MSRLDKYRAGWISSSLLLISFFVALVGIYTVTPLFHLGVFPLGYLFGIFFEYRINFVVMMIVVTVVGFLAGEIFNRLWQRNKLLVLPLATLALVNSVTYINHLYWLWCVNC